jgi:hypothetical protein
MTERAPAGEQYIDWNIRPDETDAIAACATVSERVIE